MKPDTGWQTVADLTRSHLGNPNHGCPYCGTVIQRTTDTGKTAYHPATECCPRALRRQINWRMDEIDAIKKRAREREKLVEKIQEEVKLAPTKAMAGQAQVRLDRARLNYRDYVGNFVAPDLRELSTEIARLKAKLIKLEPQPRQVTT